MDDYENDYDPYEEAMSNCYWDGVHGHVCGAIASEDCDWECPLSDEMWRGLNTPRDKKGRFTSKVKTITEEAR